MQQFIKAQSTDQDIINLLAQAEKELKWQHLQKSPQGILYRMQNGHKQMLVPRSMRQDIMKEHHDVPLIGHVGVHWTLDHVKRAFWWKSPVGRCRTIHAILSSLSIYEVKPQEKGGFIATSPPTRMKMAEDSD